MADSRRNISSVYVRDLNPRTTDETFLSYFRRECSGVRPGSEGGKIVREGGRCRYGFVNFVDAASARRAIAKKNHVIDGNRLVCKLQSRKRKTCAPTNTKGEPEPQYMRELYVGNLNVSTTKEQLREYFQKFGKVEKAYLVLDENKRSKGFGFVEFQKSSSVESVQDKRPHAINNKDVQTVRTYPKGIALHLKKPTTVLFVTQYNEEVTEDDIEDYFGEYGNITKVSASKKKRPDKLEDFKYLELEFDDYDAVDKICLEGITAKHTINGCPIRVAKCLEDTFDEKQDDQKQTQSAPKSTGNSSRRTENLSAMGITSTPIPSAPLEDLNHFPYNPQFVGSQQPSYPSLRTQEMNRQPRSLDAGFVHVQSNLYPSFDTRQANPQPTQPNLAYSNFRKSTTPHYTNSGAYSRPSAPREKSACVIS